MRKQPTWRIPFGVIGLLAALLIYGVLIARTLGPVLAGWPTVAQSLVYIVLGVVWLLPLKRFLIWMETGRWRAD